MSENYKENSIEEFLKQFPDLTVDKVKNLKRKALSKFLLQI